jgi:6-phosphogluconolactonase
MQKNPRPTWWTVLSALLLSAHVLLSNLSPAVENYFTFVSGSDGSNGYIYTYNFDPISGSLVPANTNIGTNTRIGYLAYAPARTHIYAIRTNSLGTNFISAYSINQTTGELKDTLAEGSTTPKNQTIAAKGAAYLSVHPNGKFIYVAHFDTGHVSVLPVPSPSSVTDAIQCIVPTIPPKPRTTAINAHMALLNKSGSRLYVPCLGIDRIMTYAVNPTSGMITELASTITPVGSGPRHMAFSSDEKYAYVMNELNLTMTKFAHDVTTGALTDPVTVSTLPDATPITDRSAAHVLVSPDDKFVYGSNRNKLSTDATFANIVIFSRDSVNGSLSNRQNTYSGTELSHPRNFTMDPTGEILLVAGQQAKQLTPFRINKSTGQLTRLSNIQTYTMNPGCVVVMPKASVFSKIILSAPSPVSANSKTMINAAGQDQFGNALAIPGTITWKIVSGPGTVDNKGEFTSPNTSTTTKTIIKATAGSVSEQIEITTTAATPILTKIILTTPNLTIPANTKATITAAGRDQFNNPMSISGTMTWTFVSGPGTVNSSGEFTSPNSPTTTKTIIKATAGSVSEQIEISTTAATPVLTKIILTPPNPTIEPNTTITITAAGRDQFDNAMTIPETVTWSKVSGDGTISSTGEFTSPNNPAMSKTLIKATAGSVSEQIEITTTAATPVLTTMVVTAPTTQAVINSLTAMSAAGRDQFNNPITITGTVTWSVAAGEGSVSSDGLFTAPNKAGTSTITANYGSISGQMVITIIVQSEPTPPSDNNSGGKSCGLGTISALLFLCAWAMLRFQRQEKFSL